MPFKNEIWKGILCLVTCGLYNLYYAFFEYDDDNKWPVIATWLGGGVVAGVFSALAR